MSTESSHNPAQENTTQILVAGIKALFPYAAYALGDIGIHGPWQPWSPEIAAIRKAMKVAEDLD